MLKTIPDAPYDWRTSPVPETPPRHSYHTSLVDKISLCSKPDPVRGVPVRVDRTFAQALERIRIIDNLTRGIPKVFYLVGWQYDGHDSKYPAWSEVNGRLKREADAAAVESLRWLMAQAKQSHSVVSLHINMNDAYENSPLWPEYKAAGCILGKGDQWGGEQSYLIDHAREWDTGLAQRRIDGLVASLPLQESGTIHIDAFWPTGDPQKSIPAMRRIVRYWQSLGIDVTTEGILHNHLHDGLIGLCPMVWHLNEANWGRGDEFTEREYMAVPAGLLCGGLDHSRRALAFGTSMLGQDVPDGQWQEYIARFCLNTLPWQYLNRHQRLHCNSDDAAAAVRYSDGLVCQADFANNTCRIEQDALLLRDKDDIFVPCLWAEGKEIMAFSREGCADMRRTLPPDWRGVCSATVSQITPEGLSGESCVAIRDGAIHLSLSSGGAFSIRAEQSARADAHRA